MKILLLILITINIYADKEGLTNFLNNNNFYQENKKSNEQKNREYFARKMLIKAESLKKLYSEDTIESEEADRIIKISKRILKYGK